MKRTGDRKTIRLKEYDYSSPGEYFVTICTQDKLYSFGKIIEEEMRLSSIGEIAQRCWQEIPNHFPNIELDAFVVMPNHIHGIIVINPLVGVHYNEPLRKNAFQHTIPKSLGSIIRSYKGVVSRECRKCGHHYFLWQRNFYEHIIRDDKDMNTIREYIVNNPLQWAVDKENLSRDHYHTSYYPRHTGA
ncbi:MAG: transposase [Bacteroidota bacterium]|jgi:REP element-mobilizing transposase RayT